MGINLTGMNLADYAQSDAQWYHEIEAVQTAYRQGQKARQDADGKKQQLAG